MLRTIRDRARNPIVIGAVCAAVIAAGCQLAGDDAGAPVAYDGETLYRGIVMGQGEVAEIIPEIRDTYELERRVASKEQLRLALEANDAVVAEIRAAHPAFLDEFAAAMQSGDHVRIGRALTHATTVTVEALEALAITGEAPIDDRLKGSVAVAVASYAVAIAVSVTSVFVMHFAPVENKNLTPEQSLLLREQIIDSIALRLAL